MDLKAEKQLIINADDYGTNEARNRGILEAACKGIVTTTSVIANTIKSDDSLHNLKKQFGTCIGIHLNLTMGVPLSDRPKTLLDQFGKFWNKRTLWQKALHGDLDLSEVEEEFAAQVNHLLKLGIQPDHVDGNNHIHVFPGIAEVVAGLARAFGVIWVRLPFEPFTAWCQWFRKNARKKSFIGRLSRHAAEVFTAHGLRFTDNFAGIQFPVVPKLESLKAFVANLPHGTTELMCHPGYQDITSGSFSGVEREQELYVLTHRALLDDIRAYSIRLISYSEMK